MVDLRRVAKHFPFIVQAAGGKGPGPGAGSLFALGDEGPGKGRGREGGAEALKFFTEPTTVCIAVDGPARR